MGSRARYEARKNKWAREVSFASQARHHGWWLLHNVVSHPILGIAPIQAAIQFHDWTSMHLNRRRQIKESPPPEIVRPRAWLLHNIFGHLAIGFFPCQAAFDFHDRGAEAMEEPDWL